MNNKIAEWVRQMVGFELLAKLATARGDMKSAYLFIELARNRKEALANIK